MYTALLLSFLPVFSSPALAAGLYSKSSPVLQLDARSYDKLIAKSNYTSIVEFYAPWCGHCQNLKPAYEKAASSLAGYAKVAAINCDEDSNKPFCGSMGVKGFPTLKIVKPSMKTPGKTMVEDYQGERTAKAISEIVTDKIPNHVTKLKDDDLDGWLQKTTRPKAIFFTDKGPVSTLVKALAIDFLGAMDIAQIRSSEKKAVEKFDVDEFPQAYIYTGEDQAPEKFEGELKKASLKNFFSKFAAPNPEFPAAQEAKPKASSKKDTNKASKPSSQKEAKATTSSEADATTQGATPASVATESKPTLESLASEESLTKSCLSSRVGICVMAILDPSVDADESVLSGLSAIAHKHALRRSKLFPFYSIPSSNSLGQSVISKLGLKMGENNKAVILAVNAKKSWYTQYDGPDLSQGALETWVDNIRFGDSKKEKLPEGVVPNTEDASKNTATGDGADNTKADRDEL